MFETVRRKFTKEPEYVNPFADFIRNASAGKKKKVFEHVMREAIEDQRKLMERARKDQSTHNAVEVGPKKRV